MPEAAARNPEAGALFTASVLQWLQRCGCRGVHPLDDDPSVSAAESATPVEPAPEWVTLPIGRHGSPVSGWRFGWRDDTGRPRRLLLGFDDAAHLPETARRELGAYLVFAGSRAADAGRPAHLIDRDDVAQRLHDLRNALNSLLMNAAVVNTKLPAAEREGRFALQVQADGERCAKLLQELADAIRPPESPRAG